MYMVNYMRSGDHRFPYHRKTRSTTCHEIHVFVCFGHSRVHRKYLQPYTNMQLEVHRQRTNLGKVRRVRERRSEGGEEGDE